MYLEYCLLNSLFVCMFVCLLVVCLFWVSPSTSRSERRPGLYTTISSDHPSSLSLYVFRVLFVEQSVCCVCLFVGCLFVLGHPCTSRSERRPGLYTTISSDHPSSLSLYVFRVLFVEQSVCVYVCLFVGCLFGSSIYIQIREETWAYTTTSSPIRSIVVCIYIYCLFKQSVCVQCVCLFVCLFAQKPKYVTYVCAI